MYKERQKEEYIAALPPCRVCVCTCAGASVVFCAPPLLGCLNCINYTNSVHLIHIYLSSLPNVFIGVECLWSGNVKREWKVN